MGSGGSTVMTSALTMIGDVLNPPRVTKLEQLPAALEEYDKRIRQFEAADGPSLGLTAVIFSMHKMRAATASTSALPTVTSRAIRF